MNLMKKFTVGIKIGLAGIKETCMFGFDLHGMDQMHKAAERNRGARGKSISGAPMTSLFLNDKTLK